MNTSNLKSSRKNVLAKSRELYRMKHGRYPSDDQLKVFQEEFLRVALPGADNAAKNADAIAKFWGDDAKGVV